MVVAATNTQSNENKYSFDNRPTIQEIVSFNNNSTELSTSTDFKKDLNDILTRSLPNDTSEQLNWLGNYIKNGIIQYNLKRNQLPQKVDEVYKKTNFINVIMIFPMFLVLANLLFSTVIWQIDDINIGIYNSIISFLTIIPSIFLYWLDFNEVNEVNEVINNALFLVYELINNSIYSSYQNEVINSKLKRIQINKDKFKAFDESVTNVVSSIMSLTKGNNLEILQNQMNTISSKINLTPSKKIILNNLKRIFSRTTPSNPSELQKMIQEFEDMKKTTTTNLKIKNIDKFIDVANSIAVTISNVVGSETNETYDLMSCIDKIPSLIGQINDLQNTSNQLNTKMNSIISAGKQIDSRIDNDVTLEVCLQTLIHTIKAIIPFNSLNELKEIVNKFTSQNAENVNNGLSFSSQLSSLQTKLTNLTAQYNTLLTQNATLLNPLSVSNPTDSISKAYNDKISLKTQKTNAILQNKQLINTYNSLLSINNFYNGFVSNSNNVKNNIINSLSMNFDNGVPFQSNGIRYYLFSQIEEATATLNYYRTYSMQWNDSYLWYLIRGIFSSAYTVSLRIDSFKNFVNDNSNYINSQSTSLNNTITTLTNQYNNLDSSLSSQTQYLNNINTSFTKQQTALIDEYQSLLTSIQNTINDTIAKRNVYNSSLNNYQTLKNVNEKLQLSQKAILNQRDLILQQINTNNENINKLNIRKNKLIDYLTNLGEKLADYTALESFINSQNDFIIKSQNEFNSNILLLEIINTDLSTVIESIQVPQSLIDNLTLCQATNDQIILKNKELINDCDLLNKQYKESEIQNGVNETQVELIKTKLIQLLNILQYDTTSDSNLTNVNEIFNSLNKIQNSQFYILWKKYGSRIQSMTHLTDVKDAIRWFNLGTRILSNVAYGLGFGSTFNTNFDYSRSFNQKIAVSKDQNIDLTFLNLIKNSLICAFYFVSSSWSDTNSLNSLTNYSLKQSDAISPLSSNTFQSFKLSDLNNRLARLCDNTLAFFGRCSMPNEIMSMSYNFTTTDVTNYFNYTSNNSITPAALQSPFNCILFGPALIDYGKYCSQANFIDYGILFNKPSKVGDPLVINNNFVLQMGFGFDLNGSSILDTTPTFSSASLQKRLGQVSTSSGAFCYSLFDSSKYFLYINGQFVSLRKKNNLQNRTSFLESYSNSSFFLFNVLQKSTTNDIGLTDVPHVCAYNYIHTVALLNLFRNMLQQIKKQTSYKILYYEDSTKSTSTMSDSVGLLWLLDLMSETGSISDANKYLAFLNRLSGIGNSSYV